jgi:hypothetical protein
MIGVFCGPTLAASTVRELLGDQAVVLPPAAQGDVYRALRMRPDCLVLIDGYFHGVPAVWHKEILWALSEGVPVIGAGSMGALRAAELHPFGMVGVGWVFEAFRDGVLDSDDEVVLLHASAEEGYRPASEPLVNIRRTLERAQSEGVLDPGAHRAAVDFFADLPYAERTWPALLARMDQASEPAGAALRAWLPSGRVDQKLLDAVAALEVAASGPSGPATDWVFERTAMWDEFVRVEGGREPADAESAGASLLRSLDDLAQGRQIKEAALTRLLAEEAAHRHGRVLGVDDLVEALDTLRLRLGLEDPAALTAWLAVNDLSQDGLARLLASESHVAWLTDALARELEGHVIDQLRLAGHYEVSTTPARSEGSV